MSKEIRILRKTGRLVNGNEGDAGIVYHAVADGTSLCGTKPGRLSSWSIYEGDKVTCPKCLKKLIAEKDREIEEILSSKKHFKTCAENMLDVLKTINSLLPKPQENGLNYKKVADDVVVLIKEKDKEIESLKQEIDEWVGYKFVKLQYQKAIQELEKVLTSVDVPNLNGNSQKSISLSRLRKVIQQQIKELKEKE